LNPTRLSRPVGRQATLRSPTPRQARPGGPLSLHRAAPIDLKRALPPWHPALDPLWPPSVRPCSPSLPGPARPLPAPCPRAPLAVSFRAPRPGASSPLTQLADARLRRSRQGAPDVAGRVDTGTYVSHDRQPRDAAALPVAYPGDAGAAPLQLPNANSIKQRARGAGRALRSWQSDGAARKRGAAAVVAAASATYPKDSRRPTILAPRSPKTWAAILASRCYRLRSYRCPVEQLSRCARSLPLPTHSRHAIDLQRPAPAARPRWRHRRTAPRRRWRRPHRLLRHPAPCLTVAPRQNL